MELESQTLPSKHRHPAGTHPTSTIRAATFFFQQGFEKFELNAIAFAGQAIFKCRSIPARQKLRGVQIKDAVLRPRVWLEPHLETSSNRLNNHRLGAFANLIERPAPGAVHSKADNCCNNRQLRHAEHDEPKQNAERRNPN